MKMLPPKSAPKSTKPDPDGDNDAGKGEANEAGEGTPAEEAKDAKEQAKAPAKKASTSAAKKVVGVGKASQASLKAAPRLKSDPLDPDADGEAKPSKGKPGATRQTAAFFASSARKSGARMI